MEQVSDKPEEESIFSEEEFSMKGYEKHIRNARILMFILAAFFLSPLVLILLFERSFQQTALLTYSLVMATVYIVLGLWTKKKPYTALLIALIIFVAIQIVTAILNPAAIMQAWIIKIVVIVFLSLGLRNAKESQRLMEAFGNKNR